VSRRGIGAWAGSAAGLARRMETGVRATPWARSLASGMEAPGHGGAGPQPRVGAGRWAWVVAAAAPGRQRLRRQGRPPLGRRARSCMRRFCQHWGLTLSLSPMRWRPAGSVRGTSQFRSRAARAGGAAGDLGRVPAGVLGGAPPGSLARPRVSPQLPAPAAARRRRPGCRSRRRERLAAAAGGAGPQAVEAELVAAAGALVAASGWGASLGGRVAGGLAAGLQDVAMTEAAAGAAPVTQADEAVAGVVGCVRLAAAAPPQGEVAEAQAWTRAGPARTGGGPGMELRPR